MEASEHDMTSDDFSMSSDMICELLEAAIHQILYTREIYPQTAFQRKRKYNIPIQVCLHPGVTRYVRGVVAGVRPLLESGQLKALQLAVTHPNSGETLEKFVFQLAQMSKRPHQVKEDGDLTRLEESLRALCLKLSISDSLLQQLPGRCSFKILLQVPFKAAPLLHAQQVEDDEEGEPRCAWVEADSSDSASAPAARIVPLKSISSEICKLQLYVEETTRPEEPAYKLAKESG